jgi:hypothetical protein
MWQCLKCSTPTARQNASDLIRARLSDSGKASDRRGLRCRSELIERTVAGA